MRRRWLLGTGLLAATAAAVWTLAPEVRLALPLAIAKVSSEPFWTEAPEGVAAPRPSSFADLAEHLSPAVVNIKTERTGVGRGVPELFEFLEPRKREPRPFRAEATGSGFVLSENGYIATNHHVVEDADRILVSFSTHDELEAKVVGLDPKTDLALLKVAPKKPLIAAPLGDSDALRVGDWVMAIGNPFGLEHSVTVGILSARGRRGITGGSYDDFLQTDASINPGNSGGPLIDMSGRVVGINTAINASGQGIGFAIPINMAKELLPQLREKGTVTRGWLGVSIQEVNPGLAEAVGLEQAEGALVSQVFEGSPAAKAGLQRRDVIVEFAGQPIKDYNDLPRRVAATAPGAEVDLVVMRDGKRKKLSAKVEEMAQAEAEAPNEEEQTSSSEWGFEAREMTPELAEQLSLESDAKGVVVVDVDPEAPASRALRRGDVILEVNKLAIKDPADLEKALAKDDARALLLVRRGKAELYLTLEKE